MSLRYNKLSIQFYFGVWYSWLFYPIISILITKRILDLLKSIQENKKLIEMIKVVLKSFPESVIIQVINQITCLPEVKFSNDVAKSDVLIQQNPEENELNNQSLSTKVVVINEEMEDQDLNDDISISTFFINEVKRINNNNEVISNIIIKGNADSNGDDTKCFIVKTIKVIWEQSCEAFMHVFINSTYIKKLEKEKATNNWLRLMFSSISHEFRTPINAFSNALSLLDRNNDEIVKLVRNQPMNQKNVQDSIKITDMNKKFIKIWDISSKSLLSLTEDILDMAKMEAGIFSLNEAPFIVGTLITEIKYMFDMQWERKGIRFDVFCSEELLKERFNSDMGRIKQVLMNLISNAYKFTDRGGIDLRVRLRSKLSEDQETRYLEFTVSDTGTGISKEDSQNLFQMFGVIKKNREFNMRGTGLGLTISKRLVETMGGSITVDSEERKGTDVLFTIFELNKGDSINLITNFICLFVIF